MTRVESWERRSEVPLLLLALAFLVAYAWPVLNPHLDHELETSLSIVSWTVWVAFLADFVIRIGLAEERLRYVLRHWYDVALIALPMLRPLRLLRALAFARLLSRSATRTFTGRATLYVIGTAISSVFLGALTMLDAERGVPNANINSFGDALWWACETVTTVGYGDRFPVTTTGRSIAVALMVIGIALVGSVTAAVATWFISHVQAEREDDLDRDKGERQ
ncbi:potassium channel family protein [Nocardioides sp. Kera G14]|uniref:potassium channel family protein n=1 Tax=Nocardioides sp. Kera G14 TaxID=2884264 RepID=UPI001D0F9B38|nr:potassium channel family protein [Nocardioides sp. Kera G14]UDY22925.1 potassium channel family protein [Nocardioides sp. Kera G14]